MRLKNFVLKTWDALFGEYEKDNVPNDSCTETNTNEEDTIFHFRDLPQDNEVSIDHVTYPPKESPMPILSTDYVLSTQAELIRAIESAVPLTEEEKDEYLFPVIRRLAGYVHLLPASQAHHHNGRGGLFFHSLDVGLRSVRMARRRIHDLESDQQRRYQNKGRWYLAICIAGLLHDVGKAVTDMTVTADGGKSMWKPSVEPLVDWARNNHVKDYYVSWIVNRIDKQHESASLALFQTLVPNATRAFLEESHSPHMMNEIYDALTGRARKGAVIADLVMKADGFSTATDLNRQSKEGICTGVHAPIASTIFQIMQALVQEKAWSVNEKNSPVIVSDKGVFVQWYRVVPAIIAKVQDRGMGSIPRDGDVLLEKLQESGVIEVMSEDNAIQSPFWYVLPAFAFVDLPDDETPQINYLTCVKIHNKETFFGEIAPPERVFVLLKGIGVTDEEKERWQGLTGFEAPQTVSVYSDNDDKNVSDEDVQAINEETEEKKRLEDEPTPASDARDAVEEVNVKEEVEPPENITSTTPLSIEALLPTKQMNEGDEEIHKEDKDEQQKTETLEVKEELEEESPSQMVHEPQSLVECLMPSAKKKKKRAKKKKAKGERLQEILPVKEEKGAPTLRKMLPPAIESHKEAPLFRETHDVVIEVKEKVEPDGDENVQSNSKKNEKAKREERFHRASALLREARTQLLGKGGTLVHPPFIENGFRCSPADLLLQELKSLNFNEAFVRQKTGGYNGLGGLLYDSNTRLLKIANPTPTQGQNHHDD